jgi:DNA sulfur modification protein DndD
MKLISLQLCNFRQFYGKTPLLRFATTDYNTTIIHGNNGSGKTTILNAFSWVLYHQFSPAFAEPELLVNKRAITESETGVSVECFVEIIFEHNHKRYQVKRKCYAFKDQEDQVQQTSSQLFMLVSGDDGRWIHPLEQPEDIIEKILPKSLHEYFFFDGEHIDLMFRSSERHKIAEDTKELIGVKVLERAISHLKNAKKTLTDELDSLGDITTKKLLQQRNNLESSLDNFRQQEQLILQRLAQLEKEKQEISTLLMELSSIENLQKIKQQLEAEEKRLRQSLIKANIEVKRQISTKGYTVFLTETSLKFKKLIEKLRERGEIPSGIKRQFVQQLLKNNVCICGTELIAGTSAYFNVEMWQNKAGIADIEEAVIRLETQVEELESQSLKFWQEVDIKQAEINHNRAELARVENEIDNLKDKLRNSENEDIKNLQQQSDRMEQNIRELIFNQGEINLQIENLTQEIDNLEKQIKKQESKAEKQNLAQRRLKATESAISIIQEVKQRLENQFRLALETRVKEIFQSISFTPYLPRLSANYELNLIENTSGIAVKVAASTGENQILSLSFIGGIIDMVREWSQKNTLIGLDSSQFPIVMDSPFGSLDEIYRRQVAKSIPKLANQLIVLVTKTQWRNEVETEMNNYIGKQYVLVYKTPKSDCEEDNIILNGVSYPLVEKSVNQFEYTEIIEVDG